MIYVNKKIELRLAASLTIFAFLALPLVAAPSAEKIAATVILDETGVKNLRIETVGAEATTFEETVFALGRIEPIPAKRAVVSSRIAGRITDLKVTLGDKVEAGAEVARVESRQPGEPPPTITLIAPISGVVTESRSRLGEPVEPDAYLLEITDLSEVFAIASVPEHLAEKVKPGAVAHIKVSGSSSETFKGTLLRFGNNTDRTNGTLDAIFRLPNPGFLLRSGMRAEFSIAVAKRDEVMSVPRAALLGEPSKRFIYVADDELKHAFVKTPVVVGEMNDRFVEILEGLFPGDKVVTRGAYSLSFAGGGSVSLKEALDAAHGHEHAADGGELTDAKKGQAAGAKGDKHGHEEGEEGALNIWMVISGVLFLLLIVSSFIKKGKTPLAAESASTTTTTSPEAN